MEEVSVVVKIMTSMRLRHLTNLTDHEGYRFDHIQLILPTTWLTGWLQQLSTWWAIIADLSHYSRQPARSPKITHHTINCSWGIASNYDHELVHRRRSRRSWLSSSTLSYKSRSLSPLQWM